MKIGIIDYGMGNLQSVKNALHYLGCESIISSDPEVLSTTDKLILPGVGAFRDAINCITDKGLDHFIKQEVAKDKPLLGICLGMQLLFQGSTEFGQHKGLGILEGQIVKMEVPLKVPHMGWNKLNLLNSSRILRNLPTDPYVYFVHSYHLETGADIVTSTVTYGKEIQVTAECGNVFALQFHPEKSGDTGLTILKNYIEL